MNDTLGTEIAPVPVETRGLVADLSIQKPEHQKMKLNLSPLFLASWLPNSIL